MTTPNKLPPPTTQQFLQTDGKQVGWNWADWFNRIAKLLEKASPDDGQNVTAGQIFNKHPVPTLPGIVQTDLADSRIIAIEQIFGRRPVRSTPLTLDDSQVVQISKTFQQHSSYTTPVADKENILAGQIFGA